MPKYTSYEKVLSGVPLGGIGAGKMEIFPNGSVNLITFQNNWNEPLAEGKNGILGFHFGVFAESAGVKTARLLQTCKINSFPCVEKIEYEGSFPFVRLKYIDKKLPLKTELSGFSSFIPRNNKDSSLPGTYLTFSFKNTSKRKITASLLIIGRNIVGNWGIGRFNVVSSDKDQIHLSFRNCRREPIRNDFSIGDMSISVPKGAGTVTYLGEWNLQDECFRLREKNLRLDAWDWFKGTGALPNINTKKVVEGESIELGGALAVMFEINPGQTKEIPVIYSWHFPTHTVGHMYSNWFRGSIEVSRYMYSARKRVLASTKSWHGRVMSGALPSWLKDALVNNLYPLFSSTWYGKKGEFATYEAPIVCPLMGTLDVRFYGSVCAALFFPKLELNAMRRFACAQRKDGYIPHDLGRKRIDLPSDGTTYYRWKDLCSKFVLLCYRDYLFTKDKGFLKDIYPTIKKAMRWEFAQDKDRDFLPDNEGQDQTFDMWKFYSANSYTAGIFLAALLAGIRIAKIFKDRPTEHLYREWFKKGRKNFEKKLWNYNYFINYVCNRRGCEPSCNVAQLNGQWYAHMLGLGYIAEKNKIRKAIRSILKLNGGKSPYGLINSVFSDGRINRRSFHSRNVFPGMGYAFASLCIYEGFKKEGLELAKMIWYNFAYNIKTPWNQPDVVDRRSGRGLFGDSYMRSMVIWSIFLALADRNPALRKSLKAITR